MRALVPLVLLSSLALPAAAQGDPLLAVRDADPMELARVADRLGDAAVLARLGEGQSRDVRLAAIRAARFIDGPELALEPLARIAAGRDPLLAPAAARAALAIAGELDLDALAQREVEPSSLSAARALFVALSRDARARADLRAAAEHVAARLEQLGA